MVIVEVLLCTANGCSDGGGGRSKPQVQHVKQHKINQYQTIMINTELSHVLGLNTFLTLVFVHLLYVVPTSSSLVLAVLLHPKLASKALAVVCGDEVEITHYCCHGLCYVVTLK